MKGRHDVAALLLRGIFWMYLSHGSLLDAFLIPISSRPKAGSFFMTSSDISFTTSDMKSILEEMLVDGNSRNSILKSRLVAFSPLNRCRVGPSLVPNAGRGLFATSDCPRGTIITCYPGDVLVHSSHDRPDDDDDAQDTYEWGVHVPTTVRETADLSQLTDYILQLSDECAVMGLADLDDDNAAYMGHFANDGARPPTSSAELARYVIESNAMSNVMHVSLLNCHMVTKATRDITKGEEILVTYGPEYWMEHAPGWCDEYETGSSSGGRGFG